jgi:hypothetical protein
LPLGEAETEEETGADNVEPFPEHQPQVAAEWRNGNAFRDACRAIMRLPHLSAAVTVV